MVRHLIVSALVIAAVVSCGGKIVEDGVGADGTGGGAGGGSGSGSAGDAPGAAGTPASSAIPCGKTACNVATEVCCAGLNGPASTGSCTAKGACNEISLACTSAANCVNGQVCCLSVDGRSEGATCQDGASPA